MKHFFVCASLLLLSEIALSESAHALSLTLSTGTNQPSTNATNLGSFVDSFTPAETVDFNATPINPLTSTAIDFTLVSGGKVTITRNGTTSTNNFGGVTGITNDTFAPKGPAGQVNTSNYLAVFSGISVDFTFDTTSLANNPTSNNAITLFGVDFGFVDASNKIIVTKTIDNSTFTTSTVGFGSGDIDLATFINPRTSALVTNEDQVYITLTADAGINERITKVSIVQENTPSGQTGGLETDNYAFTFFPTYATPVPFEFSPQLGILSVGTLFALKKLRREKKD